MHTHSIDLSFSGRYSWSLGTSSSHPLTGHICRWTKHVSQRKWPQIGSLDGDPIGLVQPGHCLGQALKEKKCRGD